MMIAENSFPILETVKKSFSQALKEPRAQWDVMKWIAIAMMAVNVIALVLALVTRGFNNTAALVPNNFEMFLVAVAQLVIYSIAAQNWYRQELLGENKDSTIMLAVGPGETRMIIAMLKLFACTGLPMSVSFLLGRMLGPIGMILAIGISIAASYAAIRLTLVPPLAALGDTTPLKTSWDSMQGHLLPTLGGLLLLALGFYIPVAIAGVILNIVFGYILPAVLMALLSVLAQGLLSTVFMLLVFCYVANVQRYIRV
jgi:hypothetical protein